MPTGGQNQDHSEGGSEAAYRWPLLPAWLGLVALALLVLCHPLTWGRGLLALWQPAAGLGLALIAWFGLPAAALVLLGGLIASGLAMVFVPGSLPVRGSAALVFLAADSLLLALELSLAWWVYQNRAGGRRELNEPRSAILYLLLVPFLILGLSAGIRAGLICLFAPHVQPWSVWLANLWLSKALSVLIVTPPLLALVTPLLVRRRWAVPEVVDEQLVSHRGLSAVLHTGVQEGQRLTRGDVVEVLGLAVGASILALLLFWIYRRQDVGGWQLWGLPLLLIVWASLRQGVRGGTFVAGASAALPLLFLRVGELADPQVRLLQGNLLAQCSTALLVAASASWIKASESRYRQVVSRSPVLIYSARLLEGPEGGARLHAGQPPSSKTFAGTGKAPSGGTDSTGTAEHPTWRSEAGGSTGPAAPGRSPGKLPQAEITLVSSASVVLLGCPPEQLLGDHRHWLECVYAEDREVVLAALAQLHRQKQPVTCEYRLIEQLSRPPTQPGGDQPGSFGLLGSAGRPAGSNAHTPLPPRLRWMRDTLAPHFDEDGRLVGWEGVVTEVTEQRVPGG